MSCRVGGRHGSDLAWLWLWRELVAAALIGPQVWESPYAEGVALKRTERQKEKKKKKKKEEEAQRSASNGIGLEMPSPSEGQGQAGGGQVRTWLAWPLLVLRQL